MCKATLCFCSYFCPFAGLSVFLLTTLVAQVEHSVGCVSGWTVDNNVRTKWPLSGYLVWWFTLTLSRSKLMVEVIGQSSQLQVGKNS